ncbi:hypothetical protein F5B17DRAFT_144500 [Nemania serpens]|nr:hypothetical protein F5B17DRAFT_144500 [Nemania serpens]
MPNGVRSPPFAIQNGNVHHSWVIPNVKARSPEGPKATATQAQQGCPLSPPQPRGRSRAPSDEFPSFAPSSYGSVMPSIRINLSYQSDMSVSSPRVAPMGPALRNPASLEGMPSISEVIRGSETANYNRRRHIPQRMETHTHGYTICLPSPIPSVIVIVVTESDVRWATRIQSLQPISSSLSLIAKLSDKASGPKTTLATRDHKSDAAGM